jgi:hypothetical protein
MRNAFLLAILLAASLIACTPHDDPHTAYTSGIFPDTPVNLGNINSPYDDYNSALPITGVTSPLIFSSNRNSAGKQFDFIFRWLDIRHDKPDGSNTIGENSNSGYISNYALGNILEDAINHANTDHDEFGPYVISLGDIKGKDGGGGVVYNPTFALLYATNRDGDLDIAFTENSSASLYSTAKKIAFLNSAKDDAYPCITKDSSSIYFCSNRDGNFDIYKAELPLKGGRFLAALYDSISAHSITKDAGLSSGYDDKCPYIVGNLLVFTSNRPGGFGGYDLYYSKFSNGAWGAPVNFGPAINTANDEYRPIVQVVPGFSNDFMLFSSNRPGGKGGFDLYYVGIGKMTN